MIRLIGNNNIKRVSVLAGSQQQKQFIAKAGSVKFFSSTPKKVDDLPESFVEKYKLADPTRWVPISVVGFGTALGTGLMHLSEESQIVGLFVLFVATVYNKAGPMIGKYFDESAEAILKEHNLLEDAQIEATKMVIAAHKRQLEIGADVSSIFAAQKDLMTRVVAAQSLRLKHDVRNQIVKRLDNLVQAESLVAAGIQATLVSKATLNAKKAFSAKGDAKLKSAALDAALASLENPKKPASKDLVGALFTKNFAAYRSKLQSVKGKELPLSDSEYAAVQDSVRAAARRDGLEHVKVNVPKKFKLDSVM